MASDINLQTFSLPQELSKEVETTLADWDSNRKVKTLWARDASLWTNSDEDKWLGWLDIVNEQQRSIRRFANFAAEVKTQSSRTYCSWAWVVPVCAPK